MVRRTPSAARVRRVRPRRVRRLELGPRAARAPAGFCRGARSCAAGALRDARAPHSTTTRRSMRRPRARVRASVAELLQTTRSLAAERGSARSATEASPSLTSFSLALPSARGCGGGFAASAEAEKVASAACGEVSRARFAFSPRATPRARAPRRSSDRARAPPRGRDTRRRGRGRRRCRGRASGRRARAALRRGHQRTPNSASARKRRPRSAARELQARAAAERGTGPVRPAGRRERERSRATSSHRARSRAPTEEAQAEARRAPNEAARAIRAAAAEIGLLLKPMPRADVPLSVKRPAPQFWTAMKIRQGSRCRAVSRCPRE